MLPVAQCNSPFVGGPQLTEVCSASLGTAFLTLLNTFMVASPRIGDPCGRVTPIETPASSYDFIVVGAGAAGPTIAARLSEVPHWSVLLVEAGPDEPAGAEVPANVALYLGTDLDWKYRTSNESYACLSTKGSCYWPRGKNLGGTTVHHGMAYSRGHAKDYERWVEMGNKDWSWEEVTKYFKKSEDNRELDRVGRKYHVAGGPMTVERLPYAPKFAQSIFQAAREQGFEVTEDLFGEKSITGFTIAQSISRDGVRLSSSAAFLRPNAHRKNLKVAVNATVTKVTVVNKRATGVKFVMNGKKYTVRAKKEVILSAGTVNSPQLLLLSGIGPKEHLKSVNVPVAHNLPGVGENLHNHQSFGLPFALNLPYVSEFNVDSAKQYLYNQTGPLSGTALGQVTAILPSKYTTPDDPDIQLFFAGYSATCPRGSGGPKPEKMSINLRSVNLRPTSRGRLSLKNNDPLSHPVIWSNDLATDHDVSVVVDGLRMLFKLCEAPVMKGYGCTLVHPDIPSCNVHEKDSDDYWKCAIRWNTTPENHQSGTCKMGPSSDPMAVVDPKLRVHGIKGLRVADASIMPVVVSGNTHAVITMIGERAADFIKRSWGVATC